MPNHASDARTASSAAPSPYRPGRLTVRTNAALSLFGRVMPGSRRILVITIGYHSMTTTRNRLRGQRTDNTSDDNVLSSITRCYGILLNPYGAEESSPMGGVGVPAPEIGGPAARVRSGPEEFSRRSRSALKWSVTPGLRKEAACRRTETALVKTPLPGELSSAQVVQSINREESNDGTHETKSALLRRR